MPPSKFSEQGCPACGNAFVPTADTQVGCSQSCAQRHRIATQGHNRGMLGKTHSDETKKTIGQKSKARWDAGIPEQEMERRRQNGILQGSKSSTDNTHSRSVKGKRPDLGNQFFRSKWEANYARWLNYQMEHGGDVQSWEFEPRRFDFPIKRGTNSYLPDFRVVRKDGSVEWHEVKGWMTQKGATALKRFAKYFPDETLVLIDGPVYKSIASTASSLIENWE